MEMTPQSQPQSTIPTPRTDEIEYILYYENKPALVVSKVRTLEKELTQYKQVAGELAEWTARQGVVNVGFESAQERSVILDKWRKLQSKDTQKGEVEE